MKKYILGLGLMFGLGFGSVACGGTEGDEAQTEAEQADQVEQADQAARSGGGVISYPCSYSDCVKGCVATPGVSLDTCRLVCRIDSRCV